MRPNNDKYFLEKNYDLLLVHVGARRRLVGFCPQFDALIDQMTVRETLWMYARLRGIRTADIGNVVEKLITQLTLEKYADKQAGKLRYWRRLMYSTHGTCMHGVEITPVEIS